MILGVAVAGLHASNEQPGAEDLVLFETYLSIELKRGMFLTPSFQHVWNRGFDPSREANRTSVFSLRFHKMF